MESHSYSDFSNFNSEMLDGCRALLSIATVTTPFLFDRLLKSIRSIVEHYDIADIPLSSSVIRLYSFL